MKIFKLILILLSFLIASFSLNVSAAPKNISDCVSSNGAITNVTGCNTKPDVQKVTFYKAYLCASKPGDPTASTPIDLSSCHYVFESVGGSEIEIKQGVTSPLTSGVFNKPPNGTYRYVYIEISPTMQIAAIKKFSSTRWNTNATSSGLYCWTIDSTNYSIRPLSANSTRCGPSIPASNEGYNIDIINSLDGSDNSNPFIYQKDFTTSLDKTLSAFLLQSNNKLASGAAANKLGTISKVVGYLPQDIVIDESSSQIIVNYNNYQGTSISFNNDGTKDRVDSFSGGPFDIYITVQ
jgi:hypothetical protein